MVMQPVWYLLLLIVKTVRHRLHNTQQVNAYFIVAFYTATYQRRKQQTEYITSKQQQFNQ